jgi:hypothetical protein
MKGGWNVTPCAIYGHVSQNLKTTVHDIDPNISSPMLTV